MRVLRRIGLFAIAAFVLWLGGFAWFVAASWVIRGDPGRLTDAIVVLTGGRQRIETGLALLADGRGKQLFISGVNQRVDREVLLRALGPTAAREGCCIVLGHEADNTNGNALETASWMHAEGYASLRLVTSWYHMRRALLEFRRAMPEIAIVPHPVFAKHIAPERWWNRHGAALLLIDEYDKYLGAWLEPLIADRLPPPLTRTTAEGGR